MPTRTKQPCLGCGRTLPADIYHVLHALLAFRPYRRQHYPTLDPQYVHDTAWNMIVRMLKGTDGRGGAYRKDIVYLEGNIRCWQLASHDPDVIMLGDRGKFDITNPAHLRILQQLKAL